MTDFETPNAQDDTIPGSDETAIPENSPQQSSIPAADITGSSTVNPEEEAVTPDFLPHENETSSHKTIQDTENNSSPNPATPPADANDPVMPDTPSADREAVPVPDENSEKAWWTPFSWETHQDTAPPPPVQAPQNETSATGSESWNTTADSAGIPPQAQTPYQPPFVPQGTAAPGAHSHYPPLYPAQPPYGQPPRQGYPQPPQQPPYGTAYGYGTPPGALPPKKKTPLGLKVFLWILSVLSVGTVLGFIGFTVYSLQQVPMQSSYATQEPTARPDNPNRDSDGNAPDSDGGEDGAGDGKLPNFGEVTPPDPNAEKPNIDVPENPAGIQLDARPTGQELSAEDVYEKVAVSTVTVAASMTDLTGEVQESTGTGIIATADGYIITNAHVVFNSKSSAVKISTLDEAEYDAIVIGVDRSTDLAVLKTNDHNFTPAEFGDADSLKIGEWVIAIGNPGGAQFYASLTRGVISGLNRAVAQYSENGMTYIQTDAAINPGNSGGPLVNMYGQVVGINSSKIITTGYEGMGFAIPTSKAQSLINELMLHGYIKGRTRLGITGMDYADDYNEVYGFQIATIGDDSAFANTKAQAEDIITAVEGNEVYGITSLSNLLLNYQPGDTVTVSLYRPTKSLYGEGETLDVKITLLEDAGETHG